MKEKIRSFTEEMREDYLRVLRDLSSIPAPSGKEEARAAYCKAYLEAHGAEGVYIDDAKNVVFPYECEGKDRLLVVVAHTDTVFPDTEPMPFFEDEEFFRAPGAGDDTANLIAMMQAAVFFLRHRISAPQGILFVCNSCEEGLGNLKGTRELFRSYEGRIARFLSLDSGFFSFASRCVGSHRYRVVAKTKGGHSYGAFGNRNAIEVVSEIVRQIYALSVPKKENTRTTYNVGSISGGTSVNTIAQEAEILCEYRSDDLECLQYMERAFLQIFDAIAAEKDVTLTVEKVGDRPCMGDVNLNEIEKMVKTCGDVYESVLGRRPTCHSSSTDCNIPLSLGIPALCIGCREGGGAHTREEWVKKATLPQGVELAIRSLLALSE